MSNHVSDELDKMSNPVFWGKCEKYFIILSAEKFTSMLSINQNALDLMLKLALWVKFSADHMIEILLFFPENRF